MLRVLALSAVALASVDGKHHHVDLKLTVTDTSKFGEDQTLSNKAIKDTIVSSVDGLEADMVSLWKDKEAGPTSAPTPSAETPAPSPPADGNSTDNKDDEPAKATPAPTTPAQATPAPSPPAVDSNETVDDANETDRRLADGGDVTIPVFLDLPDSVKMDDVETAVKSEDMMTTLNSKLKTAGVGEDLVTAVSVEKHSKKGTDASAAWMPGAPLLSALGAVFALVSL